MQKIKLVWEFFGEEAFEYAKHHALHLGEFVQKEQTEGEVGYEKLESVFSVAYVVIPEEKMSFYRDKLRPHKGFRV